MIGVVLKGTGELKFYCGVIQVPRITRYKNALEVRTKIFKRKESIKGANGNE